MTHHEQHILSPFIELFTTGEAMTPEILGREFLSYRQFRPTGENPLIYTKTGKFPGAGASQMVIAVMGPSAVGKDTILTLLPSELQGSMRRIITTTTRPTRGSGGAVGETYHFVGEDEFDSMVIGRQFIEWVSQGGFRYGTPKQSVMTVLETHQPLVIWRGEISGWPPIRAWLTNNQPNVATYSVFVLPEMSITEYGKRLAQKRGLVDALRNRLPNALSEITQAPTVSEALLLNPPDESGVPHQAAAAAEQLFNHLVNRLSVSV